jgi:hypothetical protein
VAGGSGGGAGKQGGVVVQSPSSSSTYTIQYLGSTSHTQGEAQGHAADARGTYKKTAVVGQDEAGVQVQDGTTPPGTALQLFGKGYLLSLKTAGCAEWVICL